MNSYILSKQELELIYKNDNSQQNVYPSTDYKFHIVAMRHNVNRITAPNNFNIIISTIDSQTPMYSYQIPYYILTKTIADYIVDNELDYISENNLVYLISDIFKLDPDYHYRLLTNNNSIIRNIAKKWSLGLR